jgi:hypothetical protein
MVLAVAIPEILAARVVSAANIGVQHQYKARPTKKPLITAVFDLKLCITLSVLNTDRLENFAGF